MLPPYLQKPVAVTWGGWTPGEPRPAGRHILSRVRRLLPTLLFTLGTVLVLISLFGMWVHVTLGPAAGPGLEVGVVTLLLSAAAFTGWYWFGA